MGRAQNKEQTMLNFLRGKSFLGSRKPAVKISPVAFEARPAADLTSLAHRQRVCLLYRHSLKLVENYAVKRSLFNSEARRLRAEFDENKNITDPLKATFLVDRGFYWLNKYPHPEPYIYPWMPGGTLYMRCEPLPPHVVEAHSNIP